MINQLSAKKEKQLCDREAKLKLINEVKPIL